MKKLTLVLSVFVELGSAICIFASSFPGTPDLSELEQSSNSIYIGEIDNFVADDNDNLMPFPPSKESRERINELLRDNPEEFSLFLSRAKPPGKYHIINTYKVKGNLDARDIELKAPQVSVQFYGSGEFTAQNGDNVIIFLNKDDDNNLTVSNDKIFFIPISKSSISHSDLSEPKMIVRQLMTKTLSEGKYPLLILNLLRNTVGNDIVESSAPYVKSNDFQIRDKALYCLAVNAQIGAIPLIVQQGEEHAKNNKIPASCVGALGNYSNKKALPFIEPLLFNRIYFFRYQAMSTVRPMADKGTIPFLLLSLLDPDPQKSIPSSAAFELSEVTHLPVFNEKNGKLKTPKIAFQKFLSWWQDELSGKHPLAEDETPRVTLREGDRYEAKDLPRLNQGLFMRSEFTRGAAIKALDKLADQSSIPYLLLAQYDPKPDIAFGAYKTLRRLLPELGAAKARGTFEAGREVLIQQGFDWWKKHLQDNLPAEMKQKPSAPAAIAGK